MERHKLFDDYSLTITEIKGWDSRENLSLEELYNHFKARLISELLDTFTNETLASLHKRIEENMEYQKEIMTKDNIIKKIESILQDNKGTSGDDYTVVLKLHALLIELV